MDKNEEIKHIKIIEDVIEQFVLKTEYERLQFKQIRKFAYLKDKADEIKEEIKKLSDEKVKHKVILIDKRYFDKEFYTETKEFLEKQNLKSEFNFSEKDKDTIELLIKKNQAKKTKNKNHDDFVIFFDVF